VKSFYPLSIVVLSAFTLASAQAATVAIDGYQTADDPAAVVLDQPNTPIPYTFVGTIEFSWDLMVEPLPGAALPIFIPLQSELLVGGQDYRQVYDWNATFGGYADPDFTLPLNVSWTSSGELEFDVTGGFCTNAGAACFYGAPSWTVLSFDDGSAQIDGTLSYDATEPSGLWLFALGIAALVAGRRASARCSAAFPSLRARA
jgi:hypothetical protein